MILKKDQVMYWPNAMGVHKCTVVKEFEGEWSTTVFCVLVHSEQINQEVYLPPSELYFSKSVAEKRLQLNKELSSLRSIDIADQVTKLVLGEEK